MGPFHNSFGFIYILVDVGYASKWMEAKATQTDDSRVVVLSKLTSSLGMEFQEL